MNQNLAYQEAWREELLDGKVVAISPATTNHNRVSGNIFLIFGSYLKGKTCVPFPDGENVFLSEKDHFVPDCMVVCDRDKIKWDGVYGAPDLVVEVLSPSTMKNDRGYKKDRYEASGVPEYWIVDPANQTIEVFLLQDGRYQIEEVYVQYRDFMLESMREEEKAALVTEFKCHLYDDLVLRLEDIFSGLL